MSGELAGLLSQRVTDGTDPFWAELKPRAAETAASPELPPPAPRWTLTLRAGRGIGVGARLWWRGRPLVVLSATHDPVSPDRTILQVEERP